jgi:hypothetical protein
MNKRDITRELARIHDALIEMPDGLSRQSLANQFKAEFPDAWMDMGPELFNDLISNEAGRIIGSNKSSSQLQLPGMGLISDRVTTINAEGSKSYKRVRYAQQADLCHNFDIMNDNSIAAARSAVEAETLMETLCPIMETHGFIHAGEAIDWLAQNTGWAA